MTPRFHRVAPGDYETADGRFRLYQLVGVSPPAWNVEEVTFDVIDSEPGAGYDGLPVDGAASKRAALALFADWFTTQEDQVFKLDTDSQSDLDRRTEVGSNCIALALGYDDTIGVPEEDRISGATDAIANILTALFGPAGAYKVTGGDSGETVWNKEAIDEARERLGFAFQSWQGDSEDYTIA